MACGEVHCGIREIVCFSKSGQSTTMTSHEHNVQQLVQAKIKRLFKALHYWSIVGTDDQWIPLTKKRLYTMTSSWHKSNQYFQTNGVNEYTYILPSLLTQMCWFKSEWLINCCSKCVLLIKANSD